MSDQDVQIVQGAYESFNKGDIPGVLGAYDQNIEWTEPGGGNAPAGTFNGPDAVAENVFGKVPETFDDFSAQVDEFDDQDGTIIAKGRFKGKNKSGADLDATFEHINEVKDGKVVRFENKVDQDAWAAGWS